VWLWEWTWLDLGLSWWVAENIDWAVKIYLGWEIRGWEVFGNPEISSSFKGTFRLITESRKYMLNLPDQIQFRQSYLLLTVDSIHSMHYLIAAPGVDLNKKPNWPLGRWNFKKKMYTKFINKQFNFTGKMYDSKKRNPKRGLSCLNPVQTSRFSSVPTF
jgi:hypothetical protein